MELGTIIWVIVAVILVWLALDVLVAGGGMTGAMMAGMGGMMGSPIGWGLVLVLVVIGLLLYGPIRSRRVTGASPPAPGRT